jgi:hypothetical protein
MIATPKFAKSVRFAVGIIQLAGTATVTQGSQSVIGDNSDYTANLTTGDTLYDNQLRVIGVVDNVIDDDTIQIVPAAPFSYTGIIYKSTSTSFVQNFEGRSIVVGFDENRFESVLVDGTISQKTRWLRLFIGLESPYLRRGSAGSADFIDVVNADIAGTAIYATVPEYAMPAVKVLRRTEGLSVSTAKYAVIPALDYIFQAESVVTTYPAWFKFTKPAPGHLL